jgi:hypothetical protein
MDAAKTAIFDLTDETVGPRYGRWLANLGDVLRWMVRHGGAYDKAKIGARAAIERR